MTATPALVPHCPKCLRPTATLSGNYANCRSRECLWQGRAAKVIYMRPVQKAKTA